jgi:tripartite-type tricarboxylate transporter receptor subunit TctC
MSTKRRASFVALLVGITGSLLTALVPAVAAAQTWPDKTTRFIVPFPAGGVLDVLTRSVAEPLQRASGHTVVVDNQPGASGNLGIAQVARAAGDGATVLFIPQGNITINATLMPNTPFTWERDFKPVTLVAYAPNVMVVHPSVPAKTVAELVAHAQAFPGKLAYASPGNGSSLHLIGELIKREAKIDMLHVPYKGTPPALQDLVGGQVQVMFGAVPTLLPAIKAGQVRALAVTTAQRTNTLPDVPTLAEAGVAGIDVPSWYGVMVPAATPPPLIERMHAALAAAMAQPEVRSKLAAQGLTTVGNAPAAFAAQIQRETAVWADVIRAARIKTE